MNVTPLRTIALALVAATACVPEEGPWMEPGQDCMQCHSTTSFENTSAVLKPWTIAGTVFPRADSEAFEGVIGVRILVKDATGKELVLKSNGAGNFYSGEEITLPITAAVEYEGRRIEMPDPANTGSCNSCHTPGHPDTEGRLYVPSP